MNFEEMVGITNPCKINAPNHLKYMYVSMKTLSRNTTTGNCSDNFLGIV